MRTRSSPISALPPATRLLRLTLAMLPSVRFPAPSTRATLSLPTAANTVSFGTKMELTETRSQAMRKTPDRLWDSRKLPRRRLTRRTPAVPLFSTPLLTCSLSKLPLLATMPTLTGASWRPPLSRQLLLVRALTPPLPLHLRQLLLELLAPRKVTRTPTKLTTTSLLALALVVSLLPRSSPSLVRKSS